MTLDSKITTSSSTASAVSNPSKPEEPSTLIKRPLKPDSSTTKPTNPLLLKPNVPKVEISNRVIVKLVGFSLSVLFLPILCYYATLHRVFKGESVYSALLAAFVANIVVGLYVVAAVYEDKEEPAQSPPTRSKKDQ